MAFDWGYAANAAARAITGVRQGRRLREQDEREQQLEQSRERRAQEQHDTMQLLGELNRSRLQREAAWEADPTKHPQYGAYVGIGMSPEQARAAVLNPALSDNLIPRPATTSSTDRSRLHDRVRELMDGGMSLDAANRQARTEFGYALPQVAGAGGSNALTEDRRNLPLYQSRTREAREAFEAAKEAMPRRPAPGSVEHYGWNPSREQQFVADSTARAGLLERAREALANTQRASDSVFAKVTGQRSASPPPDEGQPAPAQGRVTPEIQAEFDRASRQYNTLLKAGVPIAEAQAAYNAALEKIARKHGLIR